MPSVNARAYQPASSLLTLSGIHNLACGCAYRPNAHKLNTLTSKIVHAHVKRKFALLISSSTPRLASVNANKLKFVR